MTIRGLKHSEDNFDLDRSVPIESTSNAIIRDNAQDALAFLKDRGAMDVAQALGLLPYMITRYYDA